MEPPSRKPKKLNGTTLEGGGQLTRLVIALSALLAKPIHVTHIRAGRPGGGGLKSQHLAAVQWLSAATRASVEGAALGSKELLFSPAPPEQDLPSLATLSITDSSTPSSPTEPLTKETTSASQARTSTSAEAACAALFTPTALPDNTPALETSIVLPGVGAASLILQALLPFLLFSPLVPGRSADDKPGVPLILTLTAGTNVSMSPSIDHVTHVLGPTLARVLRQPRESLVELCPGRELRRGWAHGGRGSPGRVSLLIHRLAPSGSPLRRVNLRKDPGRLVRVDAVILAPSHELREEIELGLRGVVASGALWASNTQDESGEEDDDEGKREKEDGEKGEPNGERFRVCVSENSGHEKRYYLLLIGVWAGGTRVAADWLYDRKIGTHKGAEQKVVRELVEGVARCLAKRVAGREVVDEFVEDQLVVFQALAGGTSSARRGTTSLHTKTARWAVEEMVGVRFGGNGKVDGVGWVVP